MGKTVMQALQDSILQLEARASIAEQQPSGSWPRQDNSWRLTAEPMMLS